MNFTFKKEGITMSIVLFITIYFVIIQNKPNFLYNVDGSLKQFGLGYKKKTVIPLWLITILLAILSYLAVNVLMK